MCFSWNTADKKPKLEGEGEADRGRKKWQQQEVTMCVPYQRDKRDPQRDGKKKLPCASQYITEADVQNENISLSKLDSIIFTNIPEKAGKKIPFLEGIDVIDFNYFYCVMSSPLTKNMENIFS